MSYTSERWSKRIRGMVSAPAVDAFLEEIEAVCRKHKMSISHEDGHGSFLVTDFDEGLMSWLSDADDDRDRG